MRNTPTVSVNQSQSISQLQSIIHSLHLQTSKAMRSTNHDWDKITMKMVSSGIFCRSWFLQSMPTLPLLSLGSRSWTTTTASYISFSSFFQTWNQARFILKFEIRQGSFSKKSGKVQHTVFPIFLFLKFIFFNGWMGVALAIEDPWEGIDKEDFKVVKKIQNWIRVFGRSKSWCSDTSGQSAEASSRKNLSCSGRSSKLNQ